MKIKTALSTLLAVSVLGISPSFADTEAPEVVDPDATPEEVMEHIALPEDASEEAVAASARGLETANEARRDGRAFGQARAEEAREQGRNMGADRAEAARERAQSAREGSRPAGPPADVPRPN